MDINLVLQSIVLGVVQGLTEFIPVSSSGHTYLLPEVMGWTSPSTVFILFVHAGTLIALLVFFRKKIWRFIKAFFTFILRKPVSKELKQDQRILGRLVIATIPAAILGIIFEKFISGFYDNPNSNTPFLLTIGALGLLGIVFIYSDKLLTRKKSGMEKLSIRNALLLGFSQALAFLRGVSRSGVTLLSGQVLGLTRVAAAEFSFLMGAIIITGTSILGVYELLQLPTEQIQAEAFMAIIGLLAAAISGYFAIRFMLNYLKNAGLSVFGWYRIAFAIITFLLIIL